MISKIIIYLNRYIRSINAIIWILYFKNSKKLSDLLNKKFENVHILCPGPSVNSFFNDEINISDKDAIILINHALNLYPKISKYSQNIFYFSSDGTRVHESIKQNLDFLNKVFSIVSSVHLFHLSRQIIKSVDVVTLPVLTFSKKFGFVGLNKGPKYFDSIKSRPIASGFGSLIYSLQLAVKFNPKNIYMWGCDFSEKNGIRYFKDGLFERKINSFSKTKIDFKVVEKIINKNGINLIR